MKVLKNHFGVIFPLLILLFSVEFTQLANRMVKDYEIAMSDDYNIIIVSKNKLEDQTLQAKISNIKEIILLDSSAILTRLKNELSNKNLNELSKNLPNFYSLKLNFLPSPEDMKNLQQNLLAIDGIMRVETFSKTHDKIYKILVILKHIAQIFTILIILLGVTLIFKQMKIWLYEYRHQIQLMTDLGAPYWSKSAMLYKLAIIDSIISTALTCVIYAYLPQILLNFSFLDEFKIPQLQIMQDGIFLFGVSIVVSIISVSLVVSKVKA